MSPPLTVSKMNSRITQLKEAKFQSIFWTTWYYISLIFLICCFITFIVATPIDTTIQSRDTGQFWNTIIILNAYGFTFILAIIIYAVRIVTTRRALNMVPHAYYIVQKGSLPTVCVRLINMELDRCDSIAQKSLPEPGHVSHPGMMRPLLSQGGRLADTPYEDVIAVSASMIEAKSAALHPAFGRQAGMPLREYLGFLQTYGMLPTPSIVEDFLRRYEKARFSGKLMEEDEFDNYMEACRKLLISLRIPNMVEPGNSAVDLYGNDEIRSFVSNGASELSKSFWDRRSLDSKDAFFEHLGQFSESGSVLQSTSHQAPRSPSVSSSAESIIRYRPSSSIVQDGGLATRTVSGTDSFISPASSVLHHPISRLQSREHEDLLHPTTDFDYPVSRTPTRYTGASNITSGLSYGMSSSAHDLERSVSRASSMRFLARFRRSSETSVASESSVIVRRGD